MSNYIGFVDLPTEDEMSALLWLVFHTQNGSPLFIDIHMDSYKGLESKGFVTHLRGVFHKPGIGDALRYLYFPTQLGYNLAHDFAEEQGRTIFDCACDLDKTRLNAPKKLIKKKSFVKREEYFKQQQIKNSSEWEKDL